MKITGSRAITALLSLGENGWSQVQNDLFQELDSHTQYYEPIFGGFVALNEIRHSITHFMEGASYEYCMTMSEHVRMWLPDSLLLPCCFVPFEYAIVSNVPAILI